MPAGAAPVGRLALVYGRAVVWLRWPIVLGWVAMAVAATLYLPGLGGGAVSPEGLIPKHAAAIATEDRSIRDFGFPLLTELVVVQRDPHGLSTAAQQRAVQRAIALDRDQTPARGPLVFALPITNARQALPFAREDSTTVLTYLYPRATASFGAMLVGAQAYADSLGGARNAVVGVTGAIPARIAQEKAITDALPTITIVTVALIAIVLALLMRSLLSPIVTLAAAGIAYLVALRAVAWTGQRTGIVVPQELEPLVLVLLLGIVTDYSIFFLQEERRQLRRGARRLEAARAAAARIGPIVLTAGSIVACGTLTLVVGTLGFFRALGPGLAVTALVGVLATLTLIPALLAIAGTLIFRRAVRRAGRNATETPEADEDDDSGRFRRGAHRLVRSRVAAGVVVIAAISLLAFAALGIRDAKLGVTLTAGLPSDSQTARATTAAQKGFAAGVVSPTEVLIEQPGVTRKTAQLTRLQALMSHVPGVAGVVGPGEEAAVGLHGATLAKRGNAARFLVILDRDAFSAAAIDRVRRLQHTLPSLMSQSGLTGARVGVAGETALASETVAASRAALLRLAVAALGVNLFFLVVFLRALIAPLYLLIASALALAAALGLTVTISQRVLGYDELTYYVPFAAAVLLLSLGSDYNIFVVGRIWDEARRRPVEEAVAYAAPKASLSITAAGVVMAMAFAVLAIVPLVPFREFALVMALGVLVDALVVRSLLAPALVTAFGEFGGWPGSRLQLWRSRRRVQRAPRSTHEPDDPGPA